MAGIPPLAGFFGKYFLFVASIKVGYYWLVIIGMLTSFISTFYYIRIIKIMYFDDNSTIIPVMSFINVMSVTSRRIYFLLISILTLFIFISNNLLTFANLVTIACLM